MGFWKLAVILVIVIIGYTQFVSDRSQDNIENKVKEIIQDTMENSTIEEINATNSSYDNMINKITLGKIKREVEMECVINSECIESYGGSAFCEDGTCYSLS